MNSVAFKLLLKINEKLSEAQGFRARIMSLDRYFLLDTGTNRTLFHLSEGVVVEADINSHPPDITITTTEKELSGIMEKRISPMESYSKGRIKIKSSLMDKLLFSELLT